MLALGAMPGAVAADDGGAAPPAEGDNNDVAATGLTLDKPQLDLTVPGESAELTAAVEPADATAEIVWKIDDATVASVTGSGRTATVTPLKAGDATITATVKGTDGSDIEAGCTVTVTEVTYSITLYQDAFTLEPGDTEALAASISVNPSGAPTPRVIWESNNTAAAAVAADPNDSTRATVTAKAPGQATITAAFGNQKATANVSVSGITLNKSSLSLIEGQSDTLTVTPYGNAAGNAVLWTSDREDIARVEAGRVTAVSAGSAVITASVGDAYTATCRVTVSTNEADSISASADVGKPLSFSSIASAINAQCRDILGYELYYITNLSVPTSAGTIYYGYISEGDPGYGVGMNNRYYYNASSSSDRLDGLTFVPKSDFSGTAVISYAGYTDRQTTFKGTIRVDVEAVSDVTYSTAQDSPITFSTADFSAVCRNKNGRDLRYVNFSPPNARYGTLYYNYTSGDQYESTVSSNTNYGRNELPYLNNVTFVPNKSYTGTVTIPYTAVDMSGYTYSGKVTIVVSRSSGGSGDVHYTSPEGRPVTFDADDFNDVSRSHEGFNLDYVRFTLPSSSAGTLYYNYRSGSSYDSRVSSGTSYYRSRSPYLDDVTFVPKSNFTGTVEIRFTARDVDRNTFSGTVSIQVGGASSSEDTIYYSLTNDETVKFDVDDFNDLSRDYDGYALRYVRFTLPSSSEGALYYNYRSNGKYDSRVSSGTSYYRSGQSPYLSNITFVPNSNFTGTVQIPFTARDTNGSDFSGTIEITVRGGASDSITYTTSGSSPVTFNADDFDDISRDYDGYALSYVRFTLPSSSRGTLYYGYRSSGDYDSRVSSGTSYYRDRSPYLDDVTFVPHGGYTGTVEIRFTGRDVNGGQFSGTVRVRVEEGDNTLSYSTMSGRPVAFDPDDFSSAFRGSTGNTLSYVRFTLPPSSRGTLYYNYNKSDGTYERAVSSGSSYYVSRTPRLEDVVFVPDEDFTGTVEIAFSGYTSSGSREKGTVTITVRSAVASAVRYSAGTGAVTFRPGDFNSVCRDVTGNDLSFVRFTPPNSAYGRLYYGYTAPGAYESEVRSTSEYYRTQSPGVGGVSFVPAAGFSGVVTLHYTGQDTSGQTYSGTVEITVTAPTVSSYFSDLSGYSWAAASIDFLYQGGIVTGTSAGRYSPSASITRGDFVLMLDRAFHFAPASGGSGFSDVPAGSYYAQAVANAKALGIAQGDGGRFYPTQALTRQDAVVLIQRAMQVSGWSLNGSDTSVLAAFTDRGSISPYATDAMASLVELGVIRGNDNGTLNPLGRMTRAEMAVILHRVLTL